MPQWQLNSLLIQYQSAHLFTVSSHIWFYFIPRICIRPLTLKALQLQSWISPVLPMSSLFLVPLGCTVRHLSHVKAVVTETETMKEVPALHAGVPQQPAFKRSKVYLEVSVWCVLMSCSGLEEVEVRFCTNLGHGRNVVTSSGKCCRPFVSDIDDHLFTAYFRQLSVITTGEKS